MLRKPFILLLFGCFLWTGKAVAQYNNAEEYIRQYKTLAIKEMVRTGVPAAISLAQGIVESGAGTSWLAVQANNQFGIKCKSNWLGEKVYHDDDRKKECFRKYPSPVVSWQDHSNFLKSNQRYHFLFYLDPLDYKAWAYGLKQAGYATNRRYAKQLIQVIQKYHLNQYSKNGLALSKKEQPDQAFASLLNKKTNEGKPAKSKAEKGAKMYAQNLIHINKRAALYLPGGTQLISIAEQFDIPLRRLLRYNELSTDVLQQGMLIFVEKKRKKGIRKTHQVQEGETFHEIAQEEGIRLKWLLKRNHLNGEESPKVGEILVLKGYATESGNAPKRREGFFSRLIHHIFGGKEKQTLPPPEKDVEQITMDKSTKTTNSMKEPPQRTFRQYEIKSGDTLYGIAKKFGVPVEQIKKLNHLQGNLIKVGQKLQIPQSLD